MFSKGKSFRRVISFQLILLLLFTLFQSTPIKSYAETAIDFDIAGVDTTRITGGVEPDDYSYYPSVSGDGRYIAFESKASNLVDGGSDNSNDVLVYDREDNSIEVVSYDEEGVQFDVAYYSDITSDGRYVSFVANVSGRGYIFVRDRQFGTTDNLGVWCDDRPSISNNGQYITYSRGSKIYGYDSTTNTEFIIASGENPSISGDGRYVAYNYFDGSWKINVHDIQNGTVSRVDKKSSGEYSNVGNYYPKISGNGRFVSFMSFDRNITDAVGVYGEDIYVHDRDSDSNGIYDEAGKTDTMLVSKSSNGIPANSSSEDYGEGSAISDNGRYVVFKSYASNLVTGDTNDNEDLFVHDIVGGKTVRLNISSRGDQIGQWDDLYYPAISGDGLTAAYVCDSPNLVSSDTNGYLDVFISKISEDISPKVVMLSEEELIEKNLNGATLTLSLHNDSFNTDHLSPADFHINNVPGLTVESISNLDLVSCTIALAFEGDFDEDITNFNITILGVGVNSGQDITSNSLKIRGEMEYGTFQFSRGHYNVYENAGFAVLTVTRTEGSDDWVGLQYLTSNWGEEGDATATPGEDYEPAMWKLLEFQNGDTSKEITIPIINNDDVEEDGEFFYVRLSSGESGDGEIGNPSEAIVTIVEEGVLILDQNPLPEGVQNELYEHSIHAYNGTGIYNFSIANGALANGLTLTSNGTLTGTPTEYGIFTFTIEVNDGENTASEEFTLVIENPNQDTTPPTIISTLPQDNIENVLINRVIEIDFSENILVKNIDALSFKDHNHSVIDYVYEINHNKLLLNPIHDLNYLSTYTIAIGSGAVTDAVYNEFEDDYIFSFTTEAEDPTFIDNEPPAWSGGSQLTVSDLGTTNLDLSWTEATDNVGVTNYKIYKNGELLNTIASNQRSYNVSGLIRGTTYTFKVEAGDAADNWSADGPAHVVTTLSPPSSGGGGSNKPKDEEPPFWPGDSSITATNIKDDGLTLNWTEARDNIGVANYKIYQDDKLIKTVSKNTDSYDVKKLKSNQIYTFTIKATDSAGNISNDNPELTVTTSIGSITFTIEPSIVVGGEKNSRGIITFDEPANEDIDITLSSNNQKLITIPQIIRIQKKTELVTFEIKTQKVEDITSVDITASLKDGGEVSETLVVLPPYEYILQDLGKINKSHGTGVFIFDSEGKLPKVLWQEYKTDRAFNPIEQMYGQRTIPEGATVFSTNKSNVIVGELQTQINFTGEHPGTRNIVTNERINVVRGFRYSSSYGVQQIGTSGGLNSSAMDINEDGYIAGWSETLDDPWIDTSFPDGYQLAKHGFIAEPGTGVINSGERNWVEVNNLNMIDLGTLGGRNSEALGINNIGYVVGVSDTSDYSEVNEVVKEYVKHGFVYSPEKGMRDLNYLIDPELGWVIEKAYDINDIGQIIAIGTVNGEKHGSLLTPKNPADIYYAKLKLGDIRATDWFFRDVLTLTSKSVVSGYDDGTFKPDKDVDRDEFIKMVITALGFTNIKSEEGYWAELYIKKAEELGLINSSEFSVFDQAITREEMSRIIVRAMSESFIEGLDKYKNGIKDFDRITYEYQDDVLSAYGKGIIAGFPDGMFKPKNTTTRAQAATVIVRLLDSSQRVTY